MPYGNTEMRRVKTGNACDKSNDVAIVNGASQESCINNLRLGNISIRTTGKQLFHRLDGSERIGMTD